MSTLAPLNAVSPPSTMLQRVKRGILAIVVLAAGVGVLAFAISHENVANRDFVSYWAAGQQLVHHKNPYSAAGVFAIERTAGWRGHIPMFMRNPPSALFLTLPLGTIGPNKGYLLWALLIIGAWLGSVHLLWKMNGCPRNGLHFIGYFFAPVLACFIAGQTSVFPLFGLALFFYFNRTIPWFAGAALALCALKPHLFLPFGAALLVWAVTAKAYRILSGATVAFAVCCVAPLAFDPSVYRHYFAMAHRMNLKAEFLPSLSAFFRITVAPGALWLQFLPAFCGCVWAVWYFRRHRNEWDWRTHGPLLIMVSFLVAPYAWFFDAVVLLPSILYAAYRARPSALAVLFGLLIAAFVVVALNTPTHSRWYLLSNVAWFAWFIWTMRYESGPASIRSTI